MEKIREIDSKGMKGAPLEKKPFEEVKLAKFHFNDKLSKEEVAYAQYQLLLKQEILQAHLEYSTKIGIVIGLPFFDFSLELKNLGLEPKFKMVQWMSYNEMVAKNNLQKK